MNRRGHLSHKVPNVKLRPAPRRSTRRHPSPSDADVVRAAWSEAEGEDDTPIGQGSSDRPWTNIKVTFSGVEDKAALIPLVRELGGEVDSALTVHVTHVIANGFTSPKYLYAIEHHIPVLSSSWIHDAHAKWLKGDELDVPASVEAHRLQPFLGLKIAVTGIDQIDRRKQIIKYINANGGVYSKDLERSCTHLVSVARTTDTKSKASEKIRWALREIGECEMARRRGKRVEGEDFRVVYEEWIWDCVAFRGRWKEDGYDARKPRARGKVNYEDVLDGSVFVQPAKETNDNDNNNNDNDEDQPIVVRKRKRGNVETLVGELLSTTKVKEEMPDIRVASSTAEIPLLDGDVSMVDVSLHMTPRVVDKPAAEELLPSRGGPFEHRPSRLHISRAASFAAPAAAGPSRLPTTAVPHKPSTGASMPNTSAPQQPTRELQPFFNGLRFSHAIAEGYQGLENALVQHGGVVVSEEERLSGAREVDFVIVRLSGRIKPVIPEPPQGVKAPEVVTECWVEGCCFTQTLLSPDDKLVFRPLAVPTPLAGTESLHVHISGFSTETSVYLRRLLKALGCALSEKLNRRTTTHLVCAAPTGQKYDKALEWGVTVVRDSWLWNMAQSGSVEAAEEHAHDQGTNVKTTSTSPAALPSAPALVDSLVVPTAPPKKSLSPSRMLKRSPARVVRAGASPFLDEAQNPLSPPKVPTERLLNGARASPSSASMPHSSPRGGSGTPTTTELKAAVSAPAAIKPSGSGTSDDVTAALRRLAESRDAPSRTRVVRRARPGLSRTTKLGATSAAASASTSPVKDKDNGASSPAGPAPGPEDESMRITYADPVADKERRRLLEAVMRSSTSPVKRARV